MEWELSKKEYQIPGQWSVLLLPAEMIVPCILLSGIFFILMANKGPDFVAIEKKTLESEEWKALTHSEKLIYILIKANYNGSNNGEIPFVYANVTDQFSSRTISKSIKGLIKKGWLEKTKHGGLFRFYCEYKLTCNYDYLRPLKKRRKKR